MADAGTRLPPLYIAACILFGIGTLGLGAIVILQSPSYVVNGLFYIFMGFIAFGIGETLNHPKTSPPATDLDNNPKQLHRQRNSCSLGNLFDIGALLLFFGGLSTLLFPH